MYDIHKNISSKINFVTNVIFAINWGCIFTRGNWILIQIVEYTFLFKKDPRGEKYPGVDGELTTCLLFIDLKFCVRSTNNT